MKSRLVKSVREWLEHALVKAIEHRMPHSRMLLSLSTDARMENMGQAQRFWTRISKPMLSLSSIDSIVRSQDSV
ncbi:hypothetical protein VNO78_14903 [Psophocarpus tetragonolobus]|uniref:Uncharacterized protein n=1 Tax=Psophocarpus tetragonolobus TaxID=3891 RepID=A0AAN9XIP8_PSOTE